MILNFSLRLFFFLLGAIPLLRSAFGTSFFPPSHHNHYHHIYSSSQHTLPKTSWTEGTSPTLLPCFRPPSLIRRRRTFFSFLQKEDDSLETRLIGRCFSAEVGFIVGTQKILLYVPQKGRVDIILSGIVSHQETSSFQVRKDGTMQVNLSSQLNKKMSRYTCRMENPRYDEKSDTALVNIEVRLLGINKKIILK
jgi:hypothetical protein